MLSRQQARDQESGQNEEDINPDEAAGTPGNPTMARYDEQDGHAAQAFQVGTQAIRG
jgi:hypothetical protein